MKRKFRIPLLFVFVASIFFTGCSTQKNNVISRNYHGMTAYYNGYFNARELVREGERQLIEKHEEKYDRLLPVFMHGTKADGKTVADKMDKAIEKCSKVIHRHSMLIKGKEYNRYIDDNYVMIGKAKFYKKDYYPAIETFQYIPVQYPKEKSRFEALAYLVNTYVETGNQIEAETIVDYVKNEKRVPSKLSSFVYASCAHFYISVKNYPRAIEMLTKAVTHTDTKLTKARYIFILAQLHQEEGNNKKSYMLYNQVIKLNPPYELAFNAKINRARVLDLDSKNSKNIEAELLKMLKDGKNKDYFDQIYYALAGIAIRRNQSEEAVKLLENSVRASTKNKNQKALSYLELAKIYFPKPDYRKAQLCYDSAATFLSKDHPEYENVLTKKNILNKLIKNLNTIAYEDSMQALAKLSPAELDKLVDKMIKKAEEEEDRKKREAELAKGQAGSPSSIPNTLSSGSQWYFYNPAALAFGLAEFTKKWGNRKLEDDWRRSDKQSLDEFSENGFESDTAKDDSASAGIRDRKKYTKNIPVSDKQMEVSHTKIIEAFYNNAGIYREQLYDRKEAAKSLEEMLQRYPENKYKLPAYFQLYRMYADIGNDERSFYYKNLILTNAPESEYAKVIRNPNYLKEMVTEKQRINNFYSETYDAYLSSQYDKVIRNKSIADSMFKENELAPKFSYLQALAIGKTQDINSFEASLQGVVKDYPSDPVKASAQEILNYIKGMKAKGAVPSTENPAKPLVPYSMNTDTVTYYVITFESGLLNSSQVTQMLKDFNTQQSPNLNLQTASQQYDDKNLLISVKQFSGKSEAENYFALTSRNYSIFAQGDVYKDFLISAGNFQLFLKSKNVENYMNFFNANYLK